MPTFLFWNLNRKPLEHRVARIVRAQAVDIVVLAECDSDSTVVTEALATAGCGPFRLVPDSGERLRVYDRTGSGWRLLVKDQLDAWAGFAVSSPGRPNLLLFTAHMPSKLWADPSDQENSAAELATDIRNAEEREGHARTILVGDLNVNPFERAVVGSRALHSVAIRDVARRETREVRGREYPIFYNPMWGCFGDRTPGPPGTYYRSSSATVNYFWNVFDQVLLRPAVMDGLADLRIFDTDGDESLLTPHGHPDRAKGSDHLPLLFRLEW